MTIQQLLELTVSRNASDLHLVVGFPPLIRVHGDLIHVPGTEKISPQEIELMLRSLVNQFQMEIFNKNLELDFSFQFGDKGRFRTNAYRQKGNIAIALRLIPNQIPLLESLGLPQVAQKITDLKQGFILVTGPTGQGKSTTLASFISKINLTRAAHIITIEDPVEYVYPPGKSLISQREMGGDTHSWNNALRAILREDPDIVLIGEMRDLDTISSAITIAETGHLVFATLHTNSAAQSVDRIIDVFPSHQQPQIRLQLAANLEAIISQRLVPTINPGRTLAVELLFANSAARSMIRDGKSHMIDNLIQTSAELGMVSLESSLAALVRAGSISHEIAQKYALRPDLLNKMIG